MKLFKNKKQDPSAPVPNKKGGKKKKSGIGFALYALAALILLVFTLVNQERIARNLKTTGFFSKTGLKAPSFIENAIVEEEDLSNKNDVEPEGPVQIDLNDSGSKATVKKSITPRNQAARDAEEAVAQSIARAPEEEQPRQEEIDSGRTESPAQEKPAQAQEAPREKAKTEEPKVQPKKETAVKKEIQVKDETPVKTMNLKLYFMTISSNGSVARKEVTRSMKKSDSPLVDAINALIAGPDAAEEKSGCRTLVSNGTRLMGASVSNGTATLNFSGEFEFNQYGIEGLRGQLQQIVYTATAFPTVQSVQFLVDGEKKEYLGQEGVWIGTPLSRMSSF